MTLPVQDTRLVSQQRLCVGIFFFFFFFCRKRNIILEERARFCMKYNQAVELELSYICTCCLVKYHFAINCFASRSIKQVANKDK